MPRSKQSKPKFGGPLWVGGQAAWAAGARARPESEREKQEKDEEREEDEGVDVDEEEEDDDKGEEEVEEEEVEEERGDDDDDGGDEAAVEEAEEEKKDKTEYHLFSPTATMTIPHGCVMNFLNDTWKISRSREETNAVSLKMAEYYRLGRSPSALRLGYHGYDNQCFICLKFYLKYSHTYVHTHTITHLCAHERMCLFLFVLLSFSLCLLEFPLLLFVTVARCCVRS